MHTSVILSSAQCFDYVERERLNHYLAMRAGYLEEAARSAAFVRRMTIHYHTARHVEARNKEPAT